MYSSRTRSNPDVYKKMTISRRTTNKALLKISGDKLTTTNCGAHPGAHIPASHPADD